MVFNLKKSIYWLRVYNARYFISHLVKWDIKYKFRRSKLGVLWTIIQPLMMAIIIAVIFGFVFNIPMRDYAPYILSGFLIWDVLLASVVHNSHAFIKGECYIKQVSHPLFIYPLRESIVSICLFLIAFSSFIVWTVILYPEHILVGILSLPLTVFLLFILTLPVSIITSHINVRFRDYPYVMGIFMQMLWYFSPVFFKEEMFAMNKWLHMFFRYNPVTSILNLIREPFLNGRLPDMYVYLYVFGLACVCSLIAYFVVKKCERDVIFYL